MPPGFSDGVLGAMSAVVLEPVQRFRCLLGPTLKHLKLYQTRVGLRIRWMDLDEFLEGFHGFNESCSLDEKRRSFNPRLHVGGIEADELCERFESFLTVSLPQVAIGQVAVEKNELSAVSEHLLQAV